MKITAQNAAAILGAGPASIKSNLSELFKTLLEPNQDVDLISVYLNRIDKRCTQRHSQVSFGSSTLDWFERAAHEAGIVKTMIQLAKDARGDHAVLFNTVNALSSLGTLVRLANSTEKLVLCQEFVAHSGLRLCLDKMAPDSGVLCMQRHASLTCLRAFASDGYLGELLNAEQTSELMVAMCRYILSGPALLTEQILDPETTFQSYCFFNQHGAPPAQSARYAARAYAMTQENASRVVHGLLCRRNPPTQRFRTDVLKHDTELVDLLFECLSQIRPECYPESDLVSIISEVLAMFFGGSVYVVNGLETKLANADLAKEHKTDRQALREALSLLLSRSGSINTLVIAWLNLEQEKWQTIHKNFYAAPLKYMAPPREGLEDLLDIFQHRGNSRAAMLRIVATLTAIVPNELSNDTIYSLLHIGSSASQKLFPMSAIRKESDQYDYLDHNFETFRMPLSATCTEEKFDAPCQIAPEGVLGPTVLIRLFTLLAQRNKLNSSLKKLSPGVTGTTLSEVKTILNEEDIPRFLKLAISRAKERREEGHKRYRAEEEPDYAGFAYYSAAELAAALAAFDDVTKGKWKTSLTGAHAEVVMSLGNAAEMALGLKQQKKALFYATAAVQFGEKLEGTQHAVAASYLAKNRRRLERACVKTCGD